MGEDGFELINPGYFEHEVHGSVAVLHGLLGDIEDVDGFLGNDGRDVSDESEAVIRLDPDADRVTALAGCISSLLHGHDSTLLGVPENRTGSLMEGNAAASGDVPREFISETRVAAFHELVRHVRLPADQELRGAAMTPFSFLLRTEGQTGFPPRLGELAQEELFHGENFSERGRSHERALTDFPEHILALPNG
jgi:hypothetical protein